MKTVYSFLLMLMTCLFYQLPAQVQSTSTTYDPKYFDKLKWRNIGPLRGGRSLGATGSPGRPNEYYFGATGGGLCSEAERIGMSDVCGGSAAAP